MFDRYVFRLTGAGRTMVLLALFSAAESALIVAQAWALCRVLVMLWEGAGALDGTALRWLALFGAAFALIRVVGALRDAFLGRFAAVRAGELREAALRRLFEGRTGGSGSRGMGAAEGLDLVIEGAERVERYIELSLGKSMDMVVTPLVLLAVLLATDWVSGVIALLGYPFIIIFMVLIGSGAHEVAARRQLDQARLSNHFLDALRGLDTLRAFGRARGHAGAVFRASERLRATTMATLRVATLSSAVLDLFATFALAAVSVMLGFRLIDGQMQLFPALLALVLTPDFYRPIRRFGADYHATLDGKQAFTRMREVVEAPTRPVPALPEGAWGAGSALGLSHVDVAYGAEGADAEGAAAATDAEAPVAEKGSAHLALADVSLRLAGCERVAVVGASGAGKSTLMALLAGFLDPDAGEVSLAWDGEPEGLGTGMGLGAPAWLRQVAYIPQSPYIFHATVAENIAFYAPDAPRERIERAAEAMGLDALIDRLPQGLDTVIGDGEGARALSGGEAQRIAMARALVDDGRRVLLLDEPTAHLDLETELELKQRMLPVMEGRLTVIATHRLHWLHSMDRVVVLGHGRVLADGDPRELLADGTVARALEMGEGDAR